MFQSMSRILKGDKNGTPVDPVEEQPDNGAFEVPTTYYIFDPHKNKSVINLDECEVNLDEFEFPGRSIVILLSPTYTNDEIREQIASTILSNTSKLDVKKAESKQDYYGYMVGMRDKAGRPQMPTNMSLKDVVLATKQGGLEWDLYVVRLFEENDGRRHRRTLFERRGLVGYFVMFDD